MQKITSALGGLLMMVVGASPGFAATVFDQPWNEQASWDLSQAGGQFPATKVYDNFSLGAATRITDLHWTGFSDAATQPIGPFLIEIWNDAGGAPDLTSSIYSQTDSPSQTLIGPVDGISSFYTYDINALPQAFSAVADTTYWLSIQATAPFVPGELSSWGWAFSSFDPEDPNAPVNMAFRLTDTVPVSVPEPGSLALVGLALAGLSAAGRKKIG